MSRGLPWSSTDDNCLSAMAALGASITAIWRCYPERTRCAVKTRLDLLRSRMPRDTNECEGRPIFDRYPFIRPSQDKAFHALMIGRTYG